MPRTIIVSDLHVDTWDDRPLRGRRQSRAQPAGHVALAVESRATMTALLEAKRSEIAALCRKRRVRRLEIFGSAASGSFDPQTSDLDFLVEFGPLGPGERADAYFGLLEDLQELFQRPVDLVMVRAISNPYFRRAIEQTRQVLYAA